MFVFHPELLEAKAKAQEALDDAGIFWLADYSSCDLLHEEYGPECEGFHTQQVAQMALKVLRRTFPSWKLGCIWYREYHDGRWCASICKNRRACG